MSDKELLELAAKAAGISWSYEINLKTWNPLTDDGDALRLAVRLGITIGPESDDVIGKSLVRVSWLNRTHSLGEYGDGNHYAATRRAIVRAAADIGKTMK